MWAALTTGLMPQCRYSPTVPNAPMIIALLSAASSIHTIRWANAYVERGHVVHLITLHTPGQGLSRSVTVHKLPFLGGAGYILNGPKVKGIIHRVKPDVVNAHYATGYGTLARWVGKVPLVLNVWGSDVFEFPEKSTFHRWLVRQNLTRASVVVSTSKAMAARTRTLYPRSDGIAVVPFGVDTELFKPKAASRPETVTIGTVKTLEPNYGVDRLVEAFIRISRSRDLPPLRLHITGNGSQRSRLEAMLSAAGLSDRATFTGSIAHHRVSSALGELDIYVALSRAESFGVAVIEASACGLPVVVSDVGGLPEVVENGVTGMVVPGGKVELAVDALRALVQDVELRRELGRAGRELVLHNYEWGHCVGLQLAIFNSVVLHRPA